MKRAIPGIIVGIAAVILCIWGFATGWVGESTSTKAGDLYEILGLKDANGNNLDKKYGAIILDDVLQESRELYVDDKVYLPIEFISQSLNHRFYWDKHEKKLLYTLPSGTKIYKKNDKNIRIEEDGIYISQDLISKYTDVTFQNFQAPTRVVITSDWGSKIQTAKTDSDTKLRQNASAKSDILKDCVEGDEFHVLEKNGDWIKVVSEDGLTGYVKQDDMGEEKTIVLKSKNKIVDQTPTRVLSSNKRITLAWHAVYSMAGNSTLSERVAQVDGLNVISPTWFAPNDKNGNIVSYASADYVASAHQMGMEVWALISDFDGSTNKRYTDSILPYTSRRTNLVNNIVAELTASGADGVNVDFEYVNSDIADDYLQFLRELTVACHKKNKIVSVDNYVPSTWTKQYNRAEEIASADYLIIMGYDEHNNSSDSAGSVASLSFVKKGIEDTLAEVGEENSNRVINALPFYARLWSETPEQYAEGNAKIIEDEQKGSYALSSKALSMDEAQQAVSTNGAKKTWDEESGQYYAQYQVDHTTYRIWMEDTKSLQKKLQCMSEYKLAGAAFWSLGFENSNVWDTIKKYNK